MTQSRLEYATVVIAGVVLFCFFRNFFFFYLLTFIVLLPVISCLLTKQIIKKTGARVSFKAASFAQGSDIPVYFELTNSSFFPLPSALLLFRTENGFYPNEELQSMDLPLRRGKRVYTWHIKSTYAGRIVITGESVTVRDYLGLKTYKLPFDCETSVCVFPAQSELVSASIENAFSRGDEDEATAVDSTEDVTQIKDFREYIPGDRMQRVNWKISAKRDGLYVKEFELESKRTVTLLAELRRDSDETGFLDELICAYYSAALKLMELDIPFTAAWYDSGAQSLAGEYVDSADALENALTHMFMMSSYEGCPAYEKYLEAEKSAFDTALYFTSPAFAHIAEHELTGMYKESVAILWL